MFSKKTNRTAQGILLIALYVVFWKSQEPVVVATAFLVLSGAVFNVFIHIHNGEIDRKATGQSLRHNNKYIIVALVLQCITLALMGLLTWTLLYKKAYIFKTLL